MAEKMAFKYRRTQTKRQEVKSVCWRASAFASLPKAPMSELEAREGTPEDVNSSRSV